MSRLESLRKTCAVLESCLEKFLKDYGFPRCPMQLVQLAFGKTLRITTLPLIRFALHVAGRNPRWHLCQRSHLEWIR